MYTYPLCIYFQIKKYLSMLNYFQLLWGNLMRTVTLLLKVLDKSVSLYALMESSFILCGQLLK